MQLVAAEMNFPEAIFVSPKAGANAAYRVRSLRAHRFPAGEAFSLRVEQGPEAGRPPLVLVRVDGEARVQVGGRVERVAPDVFDHEPDPELAREFLADSRHHLAVALTQEGQVAGMASGVHYVPRLPCRPPLDDPQLRAHLGSGYSASVLAVGPRPSVSLRNGLCGHVLDVLSAEPRRRAVACASAPQLEP